MPLHPEARRIIESIPAGPPVTMDAAAMREEFGKAWKVPDDLPPVGRVEDVTIPAGVPVRVYTPAEPPTGAFVWFHGGGWTIGTLDENEVACRTVCEGAGVTVVSVEYRLAPENPFPAAVDDCYAAVRWAAETYGGVAVGGESAGGNLAAVMALKARDLGGPPIALQVLVSPVLGHPDDGRASYRDFADGYFLSKASMDWFFTTYPRNAGDLDDPYLLPLRSTDLHGLAPALILGAEYDVLRDEGEEYGRALQAAGVDAEIVRLDGLIHGFFGLLCTQLSDARHAHSRAVAALRRALR